MRHNKHNAQKTQVDNITFDSKLEARRYQELEFLVQAGEISELKLQPSFEIQMAFTDRDGNHQLSIKYVADFQYIERGQIVIEEVKGFETDMFKLKKKMFLFSYPQYELRVIKDVGSIFTL